jgi:hypothetical protein
MTMTFTKKFSMLKKVKDRGCMDDLLRGIHSSETAFET